MRELKERLGSEGLGVEVGGRQCHNLQRKIDGGRE